MALFETYSHTALNLLQEEKEDVHTGVMIALMLDTPEAAHLALPNGEPIDNLHITLFFFGEKSDFIDDLLQVGCSVKKLKIALAEAMVDCPVLKGEIAGVGCFTSAPGKKPFLALVDIPKLRWVYHKLFQVIRDLQIHPQCDHGFTPHITLKYLDPGERFPVTSLPALPLTFSGIHLVLGSRKIFFPFQNK